MVMVLVMVLVMVTGNVGVLLTEERGESGHNRHNNEKTVSLASHPPSLFPFQREFRMMAIFMDVLLLRLTSLDE